MIRPWIFPAVLIGGYEVYARRAAALGSDALAPPSAGAKAFVGAVIDGSLWQATGFTLGTAALGLLL
ncbi:MAG: ABC transporter permease, partial [Burkholderiaceae bacterium]